MIPSAEWVFITLEMNIITQIDINIQGEAISLRNRILPPLVTSSTRPCMGMTHKSTTSPLTLFIPCRGLPLPLVSGHFYQTKQLELCRPRGRNSMSSLPKISKEIQPKTTFPNSIILASIYVGGTEKIIMKIDQNPYFFFLPSLPSFQSLCLKGPCQLSPLPQSHPGTSFAFSWAIERGFFQSLCSLASSVFQV